MEVEFDVSAVVNGLRHPCRALDVSPTGMVFESAHSLPFHALPAINAFELHLGGGGSITTHARTIWSKDALHAVRFVVMNDADRLTIAEHIDRLIKLPVGD